MKENIKAIYQERADIYNCQIETFDESGISIIDIEQMRGKEVFTLGHFGQHLFIRKDPEMILPIDDRILSSNNVEAVIQQLMSSYQKNNRQLEKTYAYYYYLDHTKLTNEPSIAIERIDASNSQALNSFLNTLAEEDIDLADIDRQHLDPVIFGGFVNSHMVAYVSHRYPQVNQVIADIGIVIANSVRGNGYGKDMLIHEVNWCIENNLIPMYVVLDNNKASVNLVKKLGFTLVGQVYRLK